MGEGGFSLRPGPYLAAYLIVWPEYSNGIYTWLEKQKGGGIERELVLPLVYIFVYIYIYTSIHRHMYIYISFSFSLYMYMYVYT